MSEETTATAQDTTVAAAVENTENTAAKIYDGDAAIPAKGAAAEPVKQEPAKAAEPKESESGSAPEKEVTAQETAVPEKYELKLPEGSMLDPGYLKEVEAFAKDCKLSAEDAQLVVDRDNDVVSKFVGAQKAAMEKQSNEWRQQIAADREIGGEHLERNAELSRRLIEKFFPQTVRKWLDETGYGNHPDLFRGFVEIAKATGEDRMVIPSRHGGANKRSVADLLYGSTSQQQE